jgi:hypothetical protein
MQQQHRKRFFKAVVNISVIESNLALNIVKSFLLMKILQLLIYFIIKAVILVELSKLTTVD